MKKVSKKLLCILLAASLLLADAAIINSREVTAEAAKGTQATVFNSMTTEQIVAKIGKLCQKDMQTSGILASVSAAQFILESGYGKSELCQNANNCFGMKRCLSGNTWEGSTWDGTSVYTIRTREEYTTGTYTTITAEFRQYTSVEQSIADHSAYLRGAMDGSRKRYAGLVGEKDYEKAVQIIKDGGYATESSYVTAVCSIIRQYDLTKYDKVSSVKKSKKASGKTTSASAKKGNSVAVKKAAALSMKNSDCPFYVKVRTKNLVIRKGPGTNYKKTGRKTGIGIFTIVKVRSGKGSATGWGKLKSGAGWINLSAVTRIRNLPTH